MRQLRRILEGYPVIVYQNGEARTAHPTIGQPASEQLIVTSRLSETPVMQAAILVHSPSIMIVVAESGSSPNQMTTLSQHHKSNASVYAETFCIHRIMTVPVHTQNGKKLPVVVAESDWVARCCCG
jgi:predicted TIM-barrel fold metal-dependent hydrolase